MSPSEYQALLAKWVPDMKAALERLRGLMEFPLSNMEDEDIEDKEEREDDAYTRYCDEKNHNFYEIENVLLVLDTILWGDAASQRSALFDEINAMANRKMVAAEDTAMEAATAVAQNEARAEVHAVKQRCQDEIMHAMAEKTAAQLQMSEMETAMENMVAEYSLKEGNLEAEVERRVNERLYGRAPEDRTGKRAVIIGV